MRRADHAACQGQAELDGLSLAIFFKFSLLVNRQEGVGLVIRTSGRFPFFRLIPNGFVSLPGILLNLKVYYAAFTDICIAVCRPLWTRRYYAFSYEF